MEVHLSAETEVQLAQVAAAQGRDTAALAQEVLGEYAKAEAKFIAAVEAGEAELANGDYVTEEEVEAWFKGLVKG